MAAPIETYRGFVYPWCIDHMGHLNVQSYVARFDEASWHFLAALGLTPAFLAAQDRGLVALDQRIQYRREVHAGSLLAVSTGLREAGAKTLRYQHRMRNCEAEGEVATMDLLVGYLDKSSRRLVPLPEAVLATARDWLADPPGPAP
ncbi:acyl-CoA thioesterase [Ramlibacter pallidus]|uniref:Acyl-CoA thioesterase n=1 Tax=Ramlibacter pallidus TaxID=2780087 RepID=A0ABR9RZD6_9BURK|nr:thioesterase family protein [Ramlibacter pallidus]MBE7366626.1 acyl-CoA thioesterase [Ramlibacter pallidus]